jgi:hypothetical protein
VESADSCTGREFVCELDWVGGVRVVGRSVAGCVCRGGGSGALRRGGGLGVTEVVEGLSWGSGLMKVEVAGEDGEKCLRFSAWASALCYMHASHGASSRNGFAYLDKLDGVQDAIAPASAIQRPCFSFVICHTIQCSSFPSHS